MAETMIPSWLSQKEEGSFPSSHAGKSRKSFLDKTLEGIAEIIQTTIFNERYASKEGFMQGLNARVKIVFMAAVILTASLASRIEILLLLYLLLLVLSLFSRIEIPFFVFRVWLFIPLFSALVILPALFNPITPGDPLISISDNVYITRQGVAMALFFVLRVAVSVSAVILVQLVTKWNDILSSLSFFRVPTLFILILEMCYRYIFLLAKTVSDMHLARKSRTIEPSPTSKEQRWVGGRMAFLLGKSMRLAEDVYHAMVSRGFSGEAKSFTRPPLALKDYAFMGFTVIVCAALLFMELIL